MIREPSTNGRKRYMAVHRVIPASDYRVRLYPVRRLFTLIWKVNDYMNGKQLLDIILKALIPVAIALSSWCVSVLRDIGNRIDGIDRRVIAIESTRFTYNDGMKIMEQINEVKLAVARLPTEYPPQWVKDKLNKNEAKMDLILDAVNRNMERLTRVEESVKTLHGGKP